MDEKKEEKKEEKPEFSKEYLERLTWNKGDLTEIKDYDKKKKIAEDRKLMEKQK
jgi:hypothetical protein